MSRKAEVWVRTLPVLRRPWRRASTGRQQHHLERIALSSPTRPQHISTWNSETMIFTSEIFCFFHPESSKPSGHFIHTIGLDLTIHHPCAVVMWLMAVVLDTRGKKLTRKSHDVWEIYRRLRVLGSMSNEQREATNKTRNMENSRG